MALGAGCAIIRKLRERLLTPLARAARGERPPNMSLPADVEGRWEGRLDDSGLGLVLEVTRTVDGLHFGRLTSVDQGGARLPIDHVEVTGDSVRFEIRSARV